jgi:hypothetical protein
MCSQLGCQVLSSDPLHTMILEGLKEFELNCNAAVSGSSGLEGTSACVLGVDGSTRGLLALLTSAQPILWMASLGSSRHAIKS